jgi:hypothetical protein
MRPLDLDSAMKISPMLFGYVTGFVEAAVLSVFIALCAVYPESLWEVGIIVWGLAIVVHWLVALVVWGED